MNERLYSAAERYIKAGLAPIPVWPDKRKNPRLSSITEYRERLPAATEWRRWAAAYPNSNVALLTGYHGNLCALDFDDVGSWNEWSMNINPRWRDTWTVQTGRGRHVYFIAQGDPGQDRCFTRGINGVLLRARGAYIIAPPSIHYTGIPYRTIRNVPPITTRINWILAGWEEKVSAPLEKPKPVRLFSGGAGRRVSILDYVPIYGRNPKPNARGAYKAFCPLHDDDHPSAWVNPGQGRFGCNACYPGRWFDVVNIISLMTGEPNGVVMSKYRRGEL